MGGGLAAVVRRVTSHPSWLRVRFAFLLFHALSMVLVAIPAPTRGTDGTHFRSKTVQAEVAAWASRLGALGIRRSPKVLEEDVIQLSRIWVTARRALLGPSIFYQRAVNARQGWYMFTGPDRQPQRFVLDAKTKSGVDVPIFEFNRKVSAPELVAPNLLESYRIRRMMLFTVWSGRKETFAEVCRAFEKRVRARRDDLAEVRCRLMERTSAHPSRSEGDRTEREARKLVLGGAPEKGKPSRKRSRGAKKGAAP